MFEDLLEKFFRFGARTIAKVIYDCDFRGFEENIPKEGPAILICNHVSYMDGLILNAASTRKLRFVIDDEIYRLPFVNYFMKMDRAIPILPQKDSVKKAIEKVSEGLDAGDVIAIFPEGQLTYTGHMIRFKFGIEWMLANNKVDVIPVALIGMWGSIFSRKYLGQKWWWIPRKIRRKVWVICGKKIPHDKATINNMQRSIMKLKGNFRAN